MSYTQEEIKAAGLDDFRVFLRQVWDYLNLPPPTPVQNDIAFNLQHGPRRFIIQAFRGVGKSWITVAFVLWTLLLDPQKKILVVSANQQLADDFSKFCKQIIHGMPMLQHLAPRLGQKDSAISFEVGPATDSKDPSVKSAGITGQITGNRADLIVVDDVEIPKNSYTHLLRERLAELVKEFDAVLKPGGRIVYLGTPQVEATLYNRLIQRGYEIRIWPIQIPERVEAYSGRLAPYIHGLIARGAAVHDPVDPKRFSRSEIDERMASYGASGFALQFMLDTNPAEIDKHPLKTKDLLIHDVDLELGNVSLVWGFTPATVLQDLQSGGFDGDAYVRAAWQSQEMVKFQGTVMYIDPSGRGSDETAFAIIRYLNGLLYLVDVGGFSDGFGEATLNALATRAVRHRVNYWVAEENYGGGMFASLLKPVLIRVAKEMKGFAPSYDEEFDAWSSTQKELRILDTLEPVVRQHRLVVDRRVIEADLQQQHDKERFSFIQQFTRMARIKGCLPNEDRLEAVAGAVSYWTVKMSRDNERALQDHKDSKRDAELKKYLDHVVNFGPRKRSRSNGYLTWTKKR